MFKYHTFDNKIELLAEIVGSVLDRQGEGVGYEIGVWKGDTSTELLKRFPGLRMIGVDPYLSWRSYGIAPVHAVVLDGINHYLWYESEKEADGIYNFALGRFREFGNRATLIRKRSGEVLETVENDSLDFVYIDGNHYFDFVLEDIREWQKKVRPGGYVIGDDFNWRRDLKNVGAAVVECFGFDYGMMADTWFWKKR